MFCPKCGKINPDNSETCSGCNASLIEAKAAIPEKKRSFLKPALITAIIVILLIVVLFFFCGCDKIQPPDPNMTF